MAKRGKKQIDPIAAASGKTPSVVLDAFEPAAARYTMRQWLLLESMGIPLAYGRAVTYRDTIAAWLVLTAEEKTRAAHRAKKLDAMIEEFAATRSPGELVSMGHAVKEAVRLSFIPVDDPSRAGEEKKSSPGAGGGPTP